MSHDQAQGACPGGFISYEALTRFMIIKPMLYLNSKICMQISIDCFYAGLIKRRRTQSLTNGTEQSCENFNKHIGLQDASYQSDLPEYFDITLHGASP